MSSTPRTVRSSSTEKSSAGRAGTSASVQVWEVAMSLTPASSSRGRRSRLRK